ncbi:MAG: DeoR/GlpR family DNA-binding transcription regulator [Chitinophagaceae bacterium]|nr:DeoR/GlpR family DNA-binding transcription regulator [Chitinophagaceae bacterium]
MSNDLLQRLAVSEDTIRRDLQELAEEGKLIKVHGGALSRSLHFTLSANDIYLPKEKKTIAQKAATLVQDGMVVLLSGGTTIRELIHHLAPELSATFITPSVPIALELMNHTGSEVIFIGNRLHKVAQIAIGAELTRQLASIQADVCLLGTNAIDSKAGITENEWEVAEVKKSMCQAARQVVALAISEKLNTVQPFQVCKASAVHAVVTEFEPHDERLAAYRSAGIQCI